MQNEETVKTTTTVKPDTQKETETKTKETTTVQKPSTTTEESSEDVKKEQTKEAIAENNDRIGNPTKSE